MRNGVVILVIAVRRVVERRRVIIGKVGTCRIARWGVDS
jgi:hypothetical protein